jgi:uncharacterized membrane protein
MFSLPLAMPPPEMLLIWPAGFVLIFLTTGIFVTATRKPQRKSERNRRAGLGITAILSGPLIGAGLAWLANQAGAVHPADVKFTFIVHIIIGAIAGYCVGIFFAFTAFFCQIDSGGKASPAKPADCSDE